jgi:hypothetical protein
METRDHRDFLDQPFDVLAPDEHLGVEAEWEA